MEGERPRGRDYFKRMSMLDHQQDRRLNGMIEESNAMKEAHKRKTLNIEYKIANIKFN